MGLRPDWVMIGIGQPDGSVSLVASKEMTRAELEYETDTEEVRSWGSWEPLRVQTTAVYRLTAEMRAWVWITAPDYASAFATLFEQWQPGRAQRPEIGGRRELPG
jgi:hypothetical protein